MGSFKTLTPFSEVSSNVENKAINNNPKISDIMPFNKTSGIKINENEKQGNFDQDELNKLEFLDAIKYDNRKFCQFYWQQLKIKQPIINTFIYRPSFESFPIKVSVFILNITILFTLNALLYDISAISSSFHAEGKQDFLTIISNEVTRCILSTVIGVSISSAISCLLGNKQKRFENLIKKEKMQNV